MVMTHPSCSVSSGMYFSDSPGPPCTTEAYSAVFIRSCSASAYSHTCRVSIVTYCTRCRFVEHEICRERLSRRPSNTRRSQCLPSLVTVEWCFDLVCQQQSLHRPSTTRQAFSAIDNNELASQLLRRWHQAVPATRSSDVEHPRSLLPPNHVSPVACTPRCIQPRYPPALGASQSILYLSSTVSHKCIRLCPDLVSDPIAFIFCLPSLNAHVLPARGRGQLRCFLYTIYLTPMQ